MDERCSEVTAAAAAAVQLFLFVLPHNPTMRSLLSHILTQTGATDEAIAIALEQHVTSNGF